MLTPAVTLAKAPLTATCTPQPVHTRAGAVHGWLSLKPAALSFRSARICCTRPKLPPLPHRRRCGRGLHRPRLQRRHQLSSFTGDAAFPGPLCPLPRWVTRGSAAARSAVCPPWRDQGPATLGVPGSRSFSWVSAFGVVRPSCDTVPKSPLWSRRSYTSRCKPSQHSAVGMPEQKASPAAKGPLPGLP